MAMSKMRYFKCYPDDFLNGTAILNEEQFAQLLEGAPYALGMVKRLRRDHGYGDEPANVFSFPASF